MYRKFLYKDTLEKQLLEGWKEYFKEIPEPAITDIVIEDTKEWRVTHTVSITNDSTNVIS
jgi:hypothetical protein